MPPLRSGHRVFEGADLVDGDLYRVAPGEGEVGVGDDAGAGEEDDALGEGLVAEEVADELFEAALDLGEGGLAGEDLFVVSRDGATDGGGADVVGGVGD